MPQLRGRFFGSHWLRRSTNFKSVRQKYQTSPQHFQRSHFNFKKGWHRLHRRIPARIDMGDPLQPETWHRHLGGDASRQPEESFLYEERVDKVEAIWKKRGRLQLHHVGGAPQTFVCFRCGYPVKSRLQVIQDDNWDWRMCYKCYQQVLKHGQERDA